MVLTRGKAVAHIRCACSANLIWIDHEQIGVVPEAGRARRVAAAATVQQRVCAAYAFTRIHRSVSAGGLSVGYSPPIASIGSMRAPWPYVPDSFVSRSYLAK